jgi:ribonuclease HI
MNKILSAKIWWRWLKHPKDLWARLWRKKYTPNIAERDLIRWDGDDPGSLIWTAAKQNRQIVTRHAFWEIRNGRTTLFWHDSWQQWPILAKEGWAQDICAQAMQSGLTNVADYWQESPLEDTWRHWCLDRERLNLGAQVDLEPWQKEMATRKIPKNEGNDILRWGHRPQGTFSTQEAYLLKTVKDPIPNSSPWQKLWDLKHWPKITLFLWLVLHSSTLTWDNLKKRGFVGPSICALCGQAEETLNHLFNTCPFTAQVWDQAAQVMRTSDRNRDSIQETITNWRDEAFHSPILNRVWQLIPGFILWQTWKERNRRIFKDLSLPWQQCWHLCCNNIRETINIQHWSEADSRAAPSEHCILQQWALHPPQTTHMTSQPKLGSPDYWSPPPEGYIKLNFDGASKGNPGEAGYGTVFRDHQGHIVIISAGSLGHSTNNNAELWGLLNGLRIARANGFTKLIAEGDSQLIINILRRMLNGVHPDRLAPSWRLSLGLQLLSDLLQPDQAIIPSHIKRKANQVADELANLGTTWSGPDLLCNPRRDSDHPILQRCIRKAAEADNPPDGVLLRSTGQTEAVGIRPPSTRPCDMPVPDPITPSSINFDATRH